jgi:GT2 family glycosyltransferase
MSETPTVTVVALEPAHCPTMPFWRPGMSLQVQSVLYNNEPNVVGRAAASLARATQLAVAAGACASVTLRYGDSSALPCLNVEALAAMRAENAGSLTIEYDYFGGNLGSARGHNRLAAASGADFILVQNPDVVVSPRLLEVLLGCFRRAGVGMAEGKQIPIEHPKDYDPDTGETSWATTACAMIPLALFRELGGFDAESFFLYCDDVDFSWLVRRAGYKVIFQPAASCFHDKRLSQTGDWQPSGAERYYSSEAALFMAHKWSRPDLVEQYLGDFEDSGEPNQQKAARVFRERRTSGTLSVPIDSEHKVGVFDSVFFARHRYSL